jgi:hypothetical protein
VKKDIAEKWVAALRSGKYKQGKGLLRDRHNNYCCLGVLCEILDTPHSLGAYSGYYYYQDETQTAYATILPKTVQSRAGMVSDRGDLPGMSPLSELNDIGTPFTEIADIIEREYENL